MARSAAGRPHGDPIRTSPWWLPAVFVVLGIVWLAMAVFADGPSALQAVVGVVWLVAAALVERQRRRP